MNRATIPVIVVFTPNTLSSLGLRDILARLLPFAVIRVCDSVEQISALDPADIFHIFVSSQLLIENGALFEPLRQKSIVLSNGTPAAAAIKGYHQINIQQSEEQIIASIQALQSHAHGSTHPAQTEEECRELLSPREVEVARLLVEGLINKEIAARLNIGITTVITHRKNIFEKLGIRSLAGLTIYAIMKRMVEI